MTTQVAIVRDAEAEIRWRNWQERGEKADRRTAKRMHALTILVGVAFLVWLIVRLA